MDLSKPHDHGLRGQSPHRAVRSSDAGANYVQKKVTRQNMASLLGKHVGTGDLLIDLAWNIDCGEITQWCHDNG